ncbi:helix-turn-helix domain-containing protein [Paenibacillus doosanensis]|uniref:Carbohydrate diacid regulator n=1 Tax=Paenibacillus konkukensis TaxID=2020716 RepID=A0ABY4RQP1_9BACL|nr:MULTISPECIES: helix-turn-helix domain-containing protein [Paenibacillus]MCS7459254.1 helix-turn-helix domain-containing protein [Paenibacillus doosanensis]UQZ84305.1 Carbohydrate diacid regulator [Paenibacillus konkukensis]
MDWEPLRQQLEQIFEGPVRLSRWTFEQWLREADTEAKGKGAPPKSLQYEGQIVFLVHKEQQDALVLSIDAARLNQAERKLVEMMLDTRRAQDKKAVPAASEEERKAGMVRDWFKQQQDLGLTNAEMPDALVAQLSLYSTKIPILLYGDYSQSRRVSYQELKKLLESFFDAEMILIPLMDKEWLILGSEKMLSMDTTDEREYGEEDTLEDTLAAVGYGLHEMLENEWVGECHLAIHYPMTPAKSLYATVLQLRETMMLGRTYHMGSNMHLPWMLQLEKLIHLIPEAEKAGFLERVLKRLDSALDAETMTTLEQFFQLDCNVSETAKKLYIHRNTLLYRLDKFKQETGLDVRTFNDAVLVKIALLLYKVTKRK